MQKKDCFLVGTIFKLHGYKGEVNIYNNNQIVFDWNKINHFLIEKNNTLIPFFITKARHKKKDIILVKFEEINSENEATSILKNKIYLPKNILLEDKKKKPINNQELIGFTVIDLKLGLLGEITYINSQTAQKLIYVAKEKEAEEFCFPMHKEFLKKIDLENKLIQVKVPKELIDLN